MASRVGDICVDLAPCFPRSFEDMKRIDPKANSPHIGVMAHITRPTHVEQTVITQAG
ncbi:hypothetical protein BVG79_p1000069 (plasmid) [Ketogulonicigenium robustum]|uniref:Uncharacterized protein n=1 Tax=Ketogulonicigenium robustum TaxID=92947 RepID=A0A1W6P3A4_9RHOB|nr:hypothetical protein BVG79_p1000069 [Ketogulonicigenium robustum]